MSSNRTTTTTGASTDHIRACAHCGLRYDWRRSPSSSLKMTYCGSLCERADLGFTIDALLQYQAPARALRAVDAGTLASPPVEPIAA